MSLTHGQDRSRIAISCSYYLLIVLAIRLLILIVATNLCAIKIIMYSAGYVHVTVIYTVPER